MTETAISLQTGFAHLMDLPCIELQYDQARAVISLYGAQVLSYQPQPEKEVLWLSPKAQWQNNAAIRGGVPVCWPWFGAAAPEFNPDNVSLPNHGLVRNKLWRLIQQQETAGGASITLQVQAADLPHCQGIATLQLSLILNDKLTITLSCNRPMPQQAALHSYFAIGDISSVLIRPLPGVYQDKVSGKQVSDLRCSTDINAETDRIYPQTANQLRLDCRDHKLALAQSGHDASVVWNPWQDRSSKIADLLNNSYNEFVCVESARLDTGSKALTLSQQIQRLSY